MNKKNKILVGCLALLLVLSVGYALFSETITINGTATAKGSFDIETTCQTGVSEEIKTSYFALGNKTWEEGAYENDTCTVIDNVVSFSTDLKYPTAARNFTIKMKNKGSITARVYAVKNGVEQSQVLTSGTYTIHDGITDEIVDKKKEFTEDAFVMSSDIPLFKKVDGTFITSSELSDFIIEEGNDYYYELEPNEEVYVVFGLRWPNGSESLLTGDQYFKFNMAVQMPFEQATN